jgi:hypothetical protein
VLNLVSELSHSPILQDAQNVTVTPAQFLGIEIKPWAKEIAELVLWIGYLQWHYRTYGRGKDDKQASEVPIPGATVTGPDTQIRLDREFVSKALRFGFNAFELTDALSPILFTGPGRKLVAMPLRLDSAHSAKPTPQPTEAAAATPPSAEAPESTPTETRNTMPTETTLTPPRRGNLQAKTEDNNGNHNGTNGQNGSALSVAETQIETVKTSLRDVILELNATLDLLRSGWHEILPGDAVRAQALRALRIHPLRSADALQLAAAMTWAGGKPLGHGFCTLDERLAAARGEGFELRLGGESAP